MGNFFDRIFRRNRNGHSHYPHSFEDMCALMFGKGSWRVDYSMKLSAVYRCVTCISDSVAQLPLEVFKVDSQGYKTKQRAHPLYRILNSKPNARMTRYVFLSLMVQTMLLKGNAFAYVKRGKGREVEQLIYIPTNFVTIVYPSTLDQPVEYIVSGEQWSLRIKASDMIHLVNHSDDGVAGISTLEYARNTLQLSNSAEKHAANFFQSGCGVGGILKSTTKLNEEQTRQLKASWEQAFSRNGGESNGIAVLGADLSYQPVTVNAKDAQLLETRQFNVIDICRFFGVSPVKAFDLSKSSYSTVEATNIGFLTDTLSPLLEKIELEFETKLFEPGENIDVRFDVSQLLRADKQSLATYYSTMFQIGAISPNEIRREIDLPWVEHGDDNYVQVNLRTLKNASEDTGIEGNNNQEENLNRQ